MSSNWVQDISDMQDKFGVREWVLDPANKDKLKDFLVFRLDFLEEEFEETVLAYANKDPEEIVDGLIDVCVIAIGTLLAFGIDADKAWNAVHEANMSKESGEKPERPNPLGLPDLLKPKGWKNPSHKGNHGNFTNNI
jgi:hypothetical protein